MLDSTTTVKGDKAPQPNDVHEKLSTASATAATVKVDTAGSANDQLVNSGALPALTIEGKGGTAESGSSGWDVAKDLGQGAWNQVTEHPGQVLESAAIGVGIGVVATLASPEIAIAAAAGGIGYAGYQLWEHAGGWFHDAKVVSDQKDFTADEVAKAHTDLQNVGAGGVDIAAGVAGGFAGSYVASALTASVEAPAAAAASQDGDSSAAAGAGTTGGDASNISGSTPGATPDAPVHTGNPTGAPGTPSDAPAQAGTTSTTPAAPTDQPAPPSTPPVSGGSDGGSGSPSDSPAANQVSDTNSGQPNPLDQPAEAAKPLEAAPAVNLDNPSANTNLEALRAAFRSAIDDAKESGNPATFNIDTRVPMVDAAGNPSNVTQADLLYQELQRAYPDNQFVFSKPDLNPGDPGYTEFPAVSVAQNGLRLSTDENAITLAQDTELPNGTSLPAGTKFANGTTYDGTQVKSVLPDGKVWATEPNGTTVEVAGQGQSMDIPQSAMSTAEKSSGQVVDVADANGSPNQILVRSSAKATDPDGKPLLDTYPVSGSDFKTLYKDGTQPGLVAPNPKTADHFKLPANMTVEASTKYGTSTASGADNDYFMKSGFADAQAPTAKNYSGPTSDAQSAAELARIRKLQGLSQ